ncbi:MAG: hypothetical protein IPM51_16575 [Sphingobacteriaceae bacterium]|nr:hypothetical protein [Sphingobacteriaceae bacterium]
MKKIIFSSILAFMATVALAQDCFTVKMSMKIEGLPPEYAGFGDNEITSYSKGEKHKQETVGMMGSNVNYFDGTTLTSLSDQMGNKTGYTMTKEELEAEDKKNKSDNKPNIEYTNDKKTIAGYECTKAIVTVIDKKDKKENKVTLWVTDKLKSPDKHSKGMSGRGMDFGDLKGYPLSIEASQNQGGMDMKVVMVATEVNTDLIDDSVFKANTEGFKMMSYTEYMDKMKAMRGGQ